MKLCNHILLIPDHFYLLQRVLNFLHEVIHKRKDYIITHLVLVKTVSHLFPRVNEFLETSTVGLIE